MITGCGVVSPLGSGLQAFWEGLLAGRSAVRPIAGFPADDLEPRAVAEVRDVPRTDPDRAGAFALEAATQALADAGLDPASVDPRRLAVALGTTLGGMLLFERWLDGDAVDGLERVPYYAPAVRVGRRFGCRGPVVTPQLACASGTQAIALAADWVRAGRADVVLAGGADPSTPPAAGSSSARAARSSWWRMPSTRRAGTRACAGPCSASARRPTRRT